MGLGLSIVPKWNWNWVFPSLERPVSFLSIVPKWNWNVLKFVRRVVGARTFNRTKVELKLTFFASLLVRRCFQSYQSGIEIKICPLVQQISLPFNRTKVELKYTINDPRKVGLFTFNRTKVELKFERNTIACENWLAFNRTKVELKLRMLLCAFRYCTYLSIVPKWNWNEGCLAFTLPTFPFQSYQSGIEIEEIGAKYKVIHAFQSYQSGIEIKNTLVRC